MALHNDLLTALSALCCAFATFQWHLLFINTVAIDTSSLFALRDDTCPFTHQHWGLPLELAQCVFPGWAS